MADVYLEAAALAVHQDRISVAEDIYSRVLIHRPETARALLGLARIFAATDRRIQAIGRYQSYLNSPAGREDAEAYLELGELHLQGGHWHQALDAFLRALKSSPNNADVYEALARAYQKGGRMDDALDSARQATEKAPRKAKHRATLAELRIAAGDAEQGSIEARRAIEYAREELRETPDQIKLLRELSGYYETYERSLEELLTAGQASLAVRIDLARAIREHAAVERTLTLHRALKVLSQAPAESKDDVRLLETLAEVQKGLSKLEDAAKTCKRLLKQDPDNAIAKRVLNDIKAATAP
jgi:tetratricopeptide (TPR) repeat protein